MTPPPLSRLPRLLVAVAVLALTVTLGATPAGADPAGPAAAALADRPASQTLTLVTGDRVIVDRLTDGRQAIAVDPAARPDGVPEPDFTVTETGDGTYVYPSDVAGLVPSV
ncbi:MAG: hypothetical protein ACRDT2_21245, partial [Natronosporangium sp.]